MYNQPNRTLPIWGTGYAQSGPVQTYYPQQQMQSYYQPQAQSYYTQPQSYYQPQNAYPMPVARRESLLGPYYPTKVPIVFRTDSNQAIADLASFVRELLHLHTNRLYTNRSIYDQECQCMHDVIDRRFVEIIEKEILPRVQASQVRDDELDAWVERDGVALVYNLTRQILTSMQQEMNNRQYQYQMYETNARAMGNAQSNGFAQPMQQVIPVQPVGPIVNMGFGQALGQPDPQPAQQTQQTQPVQQVQSVQASIQPLQPIPQSQPLQQPQQAQPVQQSSIPTSQMERLKIMQQDQQAMYNGTPAPNSPDIDEYAQFPGAKEADQFQRQLEHMAYGPNLSPSTQERDARILAEQEQARIQEAQKRAAIADAASKKLKESTNATIYKTPDSWLEPVPIMTTDRPGVSLTDTIKFIGDKTIDAKAVAVTSSIVETSRDAKQPATNVKVHYGQLSTTSVCNEAAHEKLTTRYLTIEEPQCSARGAQYHLMYNTPEIGDERVGDFAHVVTYKELHLTEVDANDGSDFIKSVNEVQAAIRSCFSILPTSHNVLTTVASITKIFDSCRQDVAELFKNKIVDKFNMVASTVLADPVRPDQYFKLNSYDELVGLYVTNLPLTDECIQKKAMYRSIMSVTIFDELVTKVIYGVLKSLFINGGFIDLEHCPEDTKYASRFHDEVPIVVEGKTSDQLASMTDEEKKSYIAKFNEHWLLDVEEVTFVWSNLDLSKFIDPTKTTVLSCNDNSVISCLKSMLAKATSSDKETGTYQNPSFKFYGIKNGGFAYMGHIGLNRYPSPLEGNKDVVDLIFKPLASEHKYAHWSVTIV